MPIANESIILVSSSAIIPFQFDIFHDIHDVYDVRYPIPSHSRIISRSSFQSPPETPTILSTSTDCHTPLYLSPHHPLTIPSPSPHHPPSDKSRSYASLLVSIPLPHFPQSIYLHLYTHRWLFEHGWRSLGVYAKYINLAFLLYLTKYTCHLKHTKSQNIPIKHGFPLPSRESPVHTNPTKRKPYHEPQKSLLEISYPPPPIYTNSWKSAVVWEPQACLAVASTTPFLFLLMHKYLCVQHLRHQQNERLYNPCIDRLAARRE